jgi:hypothetical protein
MGILGKPDFTLKEKLAKLREAAHRWLRPTTQKTTVAEKLSWA